MSHRTMGSVSGRLFAGIHHARSIQVRSEHYHILDNQAAGKIDADNASASLTLNPVSISNAGVIEATGKGGLLISQTTITQSNSGVIGATGIGAVVTLAGVTVYGGSLTTADQGLIAIGGGTNTLDGSMADNPLTNIGNVLISAATP